MKTIQHFFYCTFMAISIFCISCDAEDGMDGIDGAIGPTGEDGDANVIASEWIPEQFEFVDIDFVSFNITDPVFTQEITDNAAILIYGLLEGIDIIVPIPVQFTNRHYTYGIIPEQTSLRILGETSDGTEFTFEDFEAFRYVIIPPSSSGRASVSIASLKKDLQIKGIDINNYYEVAAYYDLN
ncbi:hypothetical protein [uncultured Dokdonia sp.]|uniref:hypothetical protein n=1 Tax=uncultured Dokdonia sp. TaxID=575653 RepID=UPI00262E7F38|nr:hypothetical protein [uncultured Dokdonia sp.]